MKKVSTSGFIDADKTGSIEEEPLAPSSDRVDLDWPQVAENVTALLDMTRRGDREIAVSALAATYGTYPSRLRQAVSSHRFINRIANDTGDAELRDQLAEQALSLVDIITRWATHDWKGALSAARALIAGRHTYRTLVAAEKKARSSSTKTPKARAALWVATVEEALFAGPACDMLRAAAPPNATDWPFAIWLEKAGAVVAVQVLGPFPTAGDYNRNIVGNIFRSLGSLHLGFGAWIVLPAGTAGQRYREMIETIAPDAIEIVELDLPL